MRRYLDGDALAHVMVGSTTVPVAIRIGGVGLAAPVETMCTTTADVTNRTGWGGGAPSVTSMKTVRCLGYKYAPAEAGSTLETIVQNATNSCHLCTAEREVPTTTGSALLATMTSWVFSKEGSVFLQTMVQPTLLWAS